MSAFRTLLLLGSLMSMTGCGGAFAVESHSTTAGDSTLSLANESSFAIYQLFVSPTAQATWGPDQLGVDVLLPGDVITLAGVDCDFYDVRIVDEDGDECVLEAVDVCAEDAVWHLDDTELALCAAF